jgi:hypothetical protein
MPLRKVCFTLFCHFSFFCNFVNFSAHLLTCCDCFAPAFVYIITVTPFSPVLSRSLFVTDDRCSGGSLTPAAAAQGPRLPRRAAAPYACSGLSWRRSGILKRGDRGATRSHASPGAGASSASRAQALVAVAVDQCALCSTGRIGPQAPAVVPT